MKERLKELGAELEENKKENEQLETKVGLLNKQLKDKDTDIKNIKEKMNNEKERALLEQEKEYQEQLQEVRDDYNERIQDLLTRLEKGDH
jgi:chromosome segregation ATPase